MTHLVEQRRCCGRAVGDDQNPSRRGFHGNLQCAPGNAKRESATRLDCRPPGGSGLVHSRERYPQATAGFVAARGSLGCPPCAESSGPRRELADHDRRRAPRRPAATPAAAGLVPAVAVALTAARYAARRISIRPSELSTRVPKGAHGSRSRRATQCVSPDDARRSRTLLARRSAKPPLGRSRVAAAPAAPASGGKGRHGDPVLASTVAGPSPRRPAAAEFAVTRLHPRARTVT